MSIAHIHTHNKPVVKTLYHTVNVMSTEAKFFAIRCSINQATHFQNVSKIIVVTDSIHSTKKIFNPVVHILQKQAAIVLNNLRKFFNCHYNNTIKFWECPSKSNWKLYKNVDIEMKSFNIILLILIKNSWDFSKKLESDDIINRWKMMFQVLDLKGNNFMDLVNSDNNILEPTYYKDDTWL